MCGIAGFVHVRYNPHAAGILAAMTDALAHRGPDGRGFYLQSPEGRLEPSDASMPSASAAGHAEASAAGGSTASALAASSFSERATPVIRPESAFLSGSSRAVAPTWAWRAQTRGDLEVGLANRRLAIVDRAAGRQPVFNERGTVVAVFNGEIYNYRALQSELRARGHRLNSEADTEVLVHLYEEHGIEGTLARLQGMFAFALWDAERDTLFLARDRFGEKPLYYADLPVGLLFASELKGLLSHPEVRRELDPGSVARYLVFEAVPAPRTIYRNLKQLEPGTFLEHRSGRTRVQRYWRAPSPERIREARARRHNDTEWLGPLQAHLIESVKLRLMGEVPMGVLLSGGLDSSLIAAMMTRFVPKLETFSLGFDERSFDESEPAGEVAKHLRANHHRKVLSARELPGMLEDISRWLDEPLADGSLVPTTALARWVREHGVVVALSGDGGDEAFGGYPTYLAHRLNPVWDRTPSRLKSLGSRLAGRLPSSFDNLSFDFKVKRLMAGLDARDVRRHALWMSGVLPDELLELLTPEVRDALRGDDLFSELEPIFTSIQGHGWPETAQLQDLQRYLPDDVLVKTDRASMAAGLEVRAPLLDPAVVEMGLELPPHLKLSGRLTKVALRRLGEAWLPKSILKRPKKGFGMPTAHWLRDMDEGVLQDWLKGPRGGMAVFEPRVVARWVREHREGKQDHRKRLWPILMFERWRNGPWGP